MRLDKYLTLTLNITRSEAKKVLKSKNVVINNKIITDGGYNISDNDEVYYENNKLIYRENIYLMMNKPSGFLCANKDNLHKTVFELINDYKVRNLFTVGRLDLDMTGLLLITNDGSFAHMLTSPSKDISKKYYVEVEGEFKESDVSFLASGITLKDEDGSFYKAKKAVLEIITPNSAHIIITEGKFHEVKKLCKAVGCNVKYLKRVSIGGLEIDKSLEEGKYREITEEEIKKIFN